MRQLQKGDRFKALIEKIVRVGDKVIYRHAEEVVMEVAEENPDGTLDLRVAGIIPRGDIQ